MKRGQDSVEPILPKDQATVILLSARTQNDGGKVLRAAAQVYKVDTDAIALKVKHEFAAKAKGKLPQKVESKPVAKARKAS